MARALFNEREAEKRNEFKLLEDLKDLTGLPIPPALRDLEQQTVRHRTVVDREDMAAAVLDLLW